MIMFRTLRVPLLTDGVHPCDLLGYHGRVSLRPGNSENNLSMICIFRPIFVSVLSSYHDKCLDFILDKLFGI